MPKERVTRLLTRQKQKVRPKTKRSKLQRKPAKRPLHLRLTIKRKLLKLKLKDPLMLLL